ncbi:MAG: hypothetical protein R3263_09650 [Myxococcota bacterium]|nr:hypothetical protein [Myxococcota bacterium]
MPRDPDAPSLPFRPASRGPRDAASREAGGPPARPAPGSTRAAHEAFHPVSLRTLSLAAVGLVTAVPPWWITTSLASAVGHAVLGIAIFVYGTWGVWRPLVEVEGDTLRYRPRLGPHDASRRLRRPSSTGAACAAWTPHRRAR